MVRHFVFLKLPCVAEIIMVIVPWHFHFFNLANHRILNSILFELTRNYILSVFPARWPPGTFSNRVDKGSFGLSYRYEWS
jgi:hypothetical protein